MKECSFCGTKIKDESKPCPGCGYNSNPSREILGNAKEIDSQIIDEKFNHGAVDVQYKILPTWVKILLIAPTLISPLMGFICSILLRLNKNADYKRFAKKLFVFTIIYSIIYFAFGIIFLSYFFISMASHF